MLNKGISLAVLLCVVVNVACQSKFLAVKAFARQSSCTNDNEDVMERATAEMLQPIILTESTKGHMGTVGIIGGHSEGSGAAYMAAIGALMVGADEVHVFCTAKAATALHQNANIKVHPSLENEVLLLQQITKMDVLVMGPGMSTEVYFVNLIPKVINVCKKNKTPLILDLEIPFWTQAVTNGLIDVTYPGVILLVNIKEFEALYKIMKSPEDGSSSYVSMNYKKYGDCIFIFRKGCTDQGMSGNPNSAWAMGRMGSAKRSTGQGHLLAGVTATYFFWATRSVSESALADNGPMFPAAVASYKASTVVRKAAQEAFQGQSRSMITSDIIKLIQESITDFE